MTRTGTRGINRVERTVSEGFAEFQKRLIPLATQRSAAAKHRQSVETSLKKKLTISSFFETGSFSHGTGIRHHSDVDLLISISNPKPESSDTALGWVRGALQDSFPFTYVHTSRPAVVVEFNGGQETWEVIPGFLTSRGGTELVYDIPGAAAGWIDTAPLAHRDYVDGVNAVAGIKGEAKRLARLLKAWKYYNNVPVSSFYLEMRATQFMATQTIGLTIWDVATLFNRLSTHELAAMNDPKSVTGRIHACSSESKRTEALSKLSTAKTRAQNALEAHNKSDSLMAFYYLDLLFGGKFPSRVV